MSVGVLYHKKSKPTGEVLGRVLNAAHGEYLTGRSDRDFLIRWGSRASGFYASGRTLNSVAAIENASDKLRSLGLMKEAGVTVPEFSTDPEELRFPFLGRKISHSKARDVVLCLQKGDYARRPRDYYVQYIPTVREFRVHVVNDEVIRVQGKFLDNPKDALPWVRNYATGYRFRAPRKNLKPDRLNMAVLAVKAHGLDFGAVDMLIGDDGGTYILEVNTAPACSPITMKAYVNAFSKLIGLDRGRLNLSVLDTLSETEEYLDDDEVGSDAQAEQNGEPAPLRF